MHFSVAKRHKNEKYSLILHSELKLLEESQPMEKVCANKEQNGNNLCLLTPLYLFSFLALRGSYGFIGLILYYLSISLTYSCIVTSWSLGQSISLRTRKCKSLETMYPGLSFSFCMNVGSAHVFLTPLLDFAFIDNSCFP